MSQPRQLYNTAAQPNHEFMFKVSDIHELNISEYGNPAGIPAVVCHGGPGAGCPPFYAGYFNPEIYRIILVDQRGSGKSTPKGCMTDNNTQALVSDFEEIRKKLNIDKWVMLGGSWGSTLALLYAEAYPQNVLGLILRGVFLGREKDMSAFLRDGCPAALTNPTEWESFKSNLNRLLIESMLPVSESIVENLYALLTRSTDEVKINASGYLSQWEKENSYLQPTAEDIAWSATPDGVNMGLTEATYFKHKCFIKENQILDNIAAISQIPVYIVQGKYDLVCPRYQAIDLEDAIKNNRGRVTRYDAFSGHAGSEPDTINYLVQATDAMGWYLKSQLAELPEKTAANTHRLFNLPSIPDDKVDAITSKQLRK